MSNIFLIGATGGVGSRLSPKLVEAGHTVKGLHRKPEQADDLHKQGVEPVLGNIIDMTADDLASAMKGCDTAVFSAGAAGSGRDKTTAIDGEGPEKLIEAARATGVNRIYLVSVIMDAGRGRDRDTSDDFEHYMAMKRRADAALAQSGIDYVILRPGTLKDDDGDGKVMAGRAITYGDVARGNVAATLAELIDVPEITNEIIELTNGETPVSDAVARLKRG
ncbi:MULTISPECIES: SDR family oxidoreductase [unclassified Hyphomonas]|uniref:SDR family oxidoreductase n=1 Tax=unclassified Hyphomonas TaxID=2630699 RepID=UPI000C66619F|nr:MULTISPECIES: SDR family oxidoreductase [unclassified Hyphomonas]MAA82786.1 NAD-dependent dehydratase [Hyphomonas sp.]MAN91399.1 NAD-dependent dehydratase [Hyphomonadaceae bacterium]HBL95192.1 NAD-dependent dehydratase [Hyphomonas sp.]HCN93196.1 NAD-dependent dehydratase [Hyphomonas sp.]|tara:strand:+ start:1116 stop:1778 length:663 start_codon:yes stop_codon:yes gene_type:complete